MYTRVRLGVRVSGKVRLGVRGKGRVRVRLPLPRYPNLRPSISFRTLTLRYAPHMLLIPVFLARLYANCRRILRGESGPWSEFARHHERAESYRASVSLVSIKETLVCSGALVSDSSALVHVEIPAESNAGQI